MPGYGGSGFDWTEQRGAGVEGVAGQFAQACVCDAAVWSEPGVFQSGLLFEEESLGVQHSSPWTLHLWL